MRWDVIKVEVHATACNSTVQVRFFDCTHGIHKSFLKSCSSTLVKKDFYSWSFKPTIGSCSRKRRKSFTPQIVWSCYTYRKPWVVCATTPVDLEYTKQEWSYWHCWPCTVRALSLTKKGRGLSRPGVDTRVGNNGSGSDKSSAVKSTRIGNAPASKDERNWPRDRLTNGWPSTNEIGSVATTNADTIHLTPLVIVVSGSGSLKCSLSLMVPNARIKDHGDEKENFLA